MKWLNGILMLPGFVVGYVLVFVVAGYDTGVQLANLIVSEEVGKYIDEHGEGL